MTQSSDQTPRTWLSQVTAGKLDLRVFDQSVYWVTANAEVLRLDAMSRDHLGAVLEMLENNVLRFHLRILENVASDVLLAAYTGEPSTEVLLHQLTGQSSADATPLQWLNATPLVRQIRKLLSDVAEHQRP